jgi:hypothetical protein
MRLQAREARDRLAPSGDYNVFACRRLLYKLRQLGFSLVRLGGILSIVPARCASQSEMSLIWACLDSNQGPRDYESPALTAVLQAHCKGGRQYHHRGSAPSGEPV